MISLVSSLVLSDVMDSNAYAMADSEGASSCYWRGVSIKPTYNITVTAVNVTIGDTSPEITIRTAADGVEFARASLVNGQANFSVNLTKDVYYYITAGADSGSWTAKRQAAGVTYPIIGEHITWDTGVYISSCPSTFAGAGTSLYGIRAIYSTNITAPIGPNNISLTILAPATGTLRYSYTNFSYNVSAIETTLTNCTLLFNGLEISTDTSIENNSINYFNNIPTALYNDIDWGINCKSLNGNELTSTNSTLLSGNLNISAYSVITGAAINSFSISVNNVLDGSTSVGNYTLGNLTGGTTLNISIDAFGYELKSFLYNVTSINSFYNFSLYDTNSLNITVYNENTGVRLSTQATTLEFTSSTSEFTNTTTTGFLYLSNLTAEEYQVTAFSSGYANRTYIITIGNRSHQNLAIYLPTGSSSTLFTISDSNTDGVLSDVLLTQAKLIDSSWVTVASQYTDITGKAKINYIPDTNYRFYLSKNGYDDLIFNLNPILFSSYNIKMDLNTLLNYSFNLDNIAIVYGPKTFNNSQATTFTFLINSPYGSLTDYGVNLTYPGGSSYVTGSNAIGGTLTTLINITNATVFDTVKLDYFYTTTVAGRRNFTDYFPITLPDGTGTLTFMANKNKTFGLGIFERVFTATLIAIFIVGIASLVGQPLPGFALNLFVQSYLTYIGFIPIWITLPSLLLGMMILIWKSGGT